MFWSLCFLGDAVSAHRGKPTDKELYRKGHQQSLPLVEIEGSVGNAPTLRGQTSPKVQNRGASGPSKKD